MTFETMFDDMPAADDPRWTNSVDFDPVQDDINRTTELDRTEHLIRLERFELFRQTCRLIVVEDHFQVSLPPDVIRFLWTTYKLGDTENFSKTHYLARLRVMLGQYR